ncbi:hypothetical protein ACHAWF_011115 [Thalassiosira exigua]
MAKARRTPPSKKPLLLAATVLVVARGALAFAPPSPSTAASAGRSPLDLLHPHRSPPVAPLDPRRRRPLPPATSARRGVVSTRLYSLFGLGPAEVAIVALVGLVLVGPSKLLEFSREVGEVAGRTSSEFGDELSELKAIPEEFAKGVEEGEIEARSRKAKDMEEVGEK